MDSKENLFIENELHANKYCARCMLIGSLVAIVCWILNLMHFFIVDATVMNVAMPIGIAFFILPFVLLQFFKGYHAWIKHIILVSFLVGLSVLSTALTSQLVLAWACPIMLTCHYYSPKFTTLTVIGVLIFMLASLYLGLYVGVWDANMMRSSNSINGYAARSAYIAANIAAGDDILVRVFSFYYVPRAAICLIVYVIGRTLSVRTHKLLGIHQDSFYQQERLGAELSVATQIQYSALPTKFPAFPDRDEFEVYASMTPSKEVGGDFYDFYIVDDDHLALLIADVSGKGVPAAMFMMAAKTIIKNNVYPGCSPAQVLYNTNNELCANTETDLFVTVWFAIYEFSTGKITASNAGHEYPILKLGNTPYDIYKSRNGFVIGGMEYSRYTDYTLQLEVGDTLFLYTDGIVEAVDARNAAYGIPRFLLNLNRNHDRPLEGLLKSVKDHVDFFAGNTPQFDDITMLALRRYK